MKVRKKTFQCQLAKTISMKNLALYITIIFFISSCIYNEEEFDEVHSITIIIKDQTSGFETQSIKANGLNVIQIEAYFPDLVGKTVKLHSSAGSFVNSTKDDPLSISRVATSDTVSAILNIGVIDGPQEITASIDNFPELTTTKEIDFSKGYDASTLSLSFPSSYNLEANSTTLLTGNISLGNYINQEITIKSNIGTFLNSDKKDELVLTLKPNESRDFSLKVGSLPSNYFINASSSDGLLETIDTINVAHSYPDSLVIIPSSYEIDSASGFIDLKVLLINSVGKSSQNIPVNFSALRNNGTENTDAGRFTGIPAVSDSNQQVNGVQFRLDTRKVNVDSLITIRSFVTGNNNETIDTEIKILVTKTE